MRAILDGMKLTCAVLPLLVAACGPAVGDTSPDWRLCVTSASIDPRVPPDWISVALADEDGRDLLSVSPVAGPAPVWQDACVVRTARELRDGVRLSFVQVPDGAPPRVLWSTLLSFPEPHRLFRQDLVDDGLDHYHLSLERAP